MTFHRVFLSTALVICSARFADAQVKKPVAEASTQAQPARLTIYLPPEAELTIEEAKIDESGEVRHFESAPLAPGKKHALKLKATWPEGEKPRTVTKRLLVEAGQELEVDIHLEDMGKDERQVLELVNQERAKAGLAPLKPNVKLSLAARLHSANMARQSMLAHELDGKNPSQRIADAGYRCVNWGENIAGGARTPVEVVRNWMNSTGHRQNILDANFQQIGIGMNPGPRGRKFWTQVFAVPLER